MAIFSTSRNKLLTNNDDSYEVIMLTNKDGSLVDSDHPLRVSLGSDSITITGNVNIGTTVEISNEEGNPIPTHAHLFDESDSEYSASNPLTIDGTVDIGNEVAINDGGNSITVDGNVSVSNFPATQTVDGTVNIGTLPEIEIKNDAGNPISVTIGGDVSLNIDSDNPLPVIGTTINPWGNPVVTVDDDTVQHTSKNRRKVSTFELTDFATFTNSKDPDIFDDQITGTASSTHDPYLGMVKLEVGSSVGDEVIRQTRRVQRYLPGRQNEFSVTVLFGTPTVGIRRRVGMFDELNGFYFEDSGDGNYRCVLRRNTAGGVLLESYTRDEWNVDKLDGTGPSGIVADPINIQHISIEYEWYGAGQIEWNFIIDNNKFPIHRINHANREGHTWSSAGAAPARVELTNIGGAAGTHTFYQGAHSLSSEGTTALLGKQKSISNALTGKTLQTARTFYPLVAIRLKTTALNSVVVPDEYSGATLDNTNVFVRTIEGATVTGGTWISYSDDSPVEYNLTATSYTGGTIIQTVFVNGGNLGNVYTYPARSVTQLERTTTTTLGDTSSTWVIAGASTNANKSGWGSVGWIEIR